MSIITAPHEHAKSQGNIKSRIMIEENYQIEEMVEQAPFYVVYEALDKRSGEKCLIKRYLVDDSSEIGQIEGWKDQFTELFRTI
ncbi:hypothetical protein GCM10023107_01450 [Actinoplanes octamycinicus]